VKRLGIVSLLALIAVACVRREPDPFPTGDEAAGWVKGRGRTFPASELWRYVDGDAERYLQAGIERTVTAEYRYRGQFEAVADVHIMRSPEAARRIFASEPAAGSRPVEAGEAGRSYGPSLTFHRGRYFVRLVAYEESAEAAEALRALAAAIDRRIQVARR